MAKSGKIEIIQVMRGIAALGIVWFHTEYGPWKSANWGIDFFFVLSGFFMMLSTETKEKISAKKFWVGRLARLLPLYYVLTVVIAIAAVVMPSAFRSSLVNFETLIKSFLFIPCYSKSGKIFPIYSVGWTINLEIFFMLIFFLVTRMSYKYRGVWTILILSILTLIGGVVQPSNAVLCEWTNLRLIDFAVGIIIYMIYVKYKKDNNEACNYISMYALILICLLSLFLGKYILGDRFYFVWNTCWSGVLLVICLCYRNVKCNSVLVNIGNMSYSIYLCHFLIIGVVVRKLIDNSLINIKNTIIIIVAVAMVLICSYIAYYVFEKKIYSFLVNNKGVKNIN